MRSRFIQKDFEMHVGLNITDFKIKRVRRINNFFLKSLFEKKLDILIENYNDISKKKRDIMFYGVDPLFPKEIEKIISSGFRPF